MKTSSDIKDTRDACHEASRISLFAHHGYNLTGASPEATLIVGRLQPKARVSVATRNLKEAGGKHLV